MFSRGSMSWAGSCRDLDVKIRSCRDPREGPGGDVGQGEEGQAVQLRRMFRNSTGAVSMPVEISQITGIPVGEIQLMIKVGSPQN
ncbi:MAG: hypothetical protein MZV70_57610 [Desulfobacterales bacterium]|nr:hypothetical protein [Desulfobacterales bacterium]